MQFRQAWKLSHRFKGHKMFRCFEEVNHLLGVLIGVLFILRAKLNHTTYIMSTLVLLLELTLVCVSRRETSPQQWSTLCVILNQSCKEQNGRTAFLACRHLSGACLQHYAAEMMLTKANCSGEVTLAVKGEWGTIKTDLDWWVTHQWQNNVRKENYCQAGDVASVHDREQNMNCRIIEKAAWMKVEHKNKKMQWTVLWLLRMSEKDNRTAEWWIKLDEWKTG